MSALVSWLIISYVHETPTRSVRPVAAGVLDAS